MGNEEPICTEISCSASTAGKISIVKYDLSANWSFTHTKKYVIPEDWTELQVKDFQTTKTIELYEEVEAIATPVYEDYMEQSVVFKNGEHIG